MEYFLIKKLRNLITDKKNAFYFSALIKEYNKADTETTYGIDIKELEKLDFNYNTKAYQKSSKSNIKTNFDSDNTAININYIKHLKNLEKCEVFNQQIFEGFLTKEEIEFLEINFPNEKLFFRDYKTETYKTFEANDFISESDFVLDNPNNIGILIPTEDLCFASIKKKYYQEHVLSEKTRVRAKNMQYLYDLIFVKFLSKQIFEKKYFDSFKYEDRNKGDILFRENEKLGYLYLIVEGKLDLYIKRNIITVNDDLMNLISLHEEFQSILLLKRKKKKLFYFSIFLYIFFRI